MYKMFSPAFATMNVSRLSSKMHPITPKPIYLILAKQSMTTEGGRPGSSVDPKELKRDVINLYKNLIYLSREWPTDLRPQIRQAFIKNRTVQDPEEIRKLIARGEYVSREIIATYHLRKYRAMKRRYYNEHRDKQMEEMFRNLSQ